jgi:hypothetical protein
MGETYRIEDPAKPAPRREWAELGDDEQTRLQVAYGHYLDSLPPTCSLETKIERFRHWLATQGIVYRG